MTTQQQRAHHIRDNSTRTPNTFHTMFVRMCVCVASIFAFTTCRPATKWNSSSNYAPGPQQQFLIFNAAPTAHTRECVQSDLLSIERLGTTTTSSRGLGMPLYVAARRAGITIDSCITRVRSENCVCDYVYCGPTRYTVH
jgi:hypothetical protein